MKKYKLLLDDTIDIDGIKLYRVQRLSDGLIGGYIQSEDNFSHEGYAMIFGNARVYGNAVVYGDARVYGDAQVYGNARVFDTKLSYGIKIDNDVGSKINPSLQGPSMQLDTCIHSWKSYTGLTETYAYCTKCDKRDTR